MRGALILLVLGLAACVGLYMGWQYLRGEKRRPVVIGTHLLLAAGALEGLATSMSGAGTALTSAGMLLIALALMGGLVSALLRRHSGRASEAVLVAHACAALAGIAVLAVWVGGG